jgi:hypothetical protein
MLSDLPVHIKAVLVENVRPVATVITTAPRCCEV